jgi:hypothetical protein
MVVLLPPNGSRTVSPSIVYNFISLSGNKSGKGAGCPFDNETRISRTPHDTCFIESLPIIYVQAEDLFLVGPHFGK